MATTEQPKRNDLAALTDEQRELLALRLRKAQAAIARPSTAAPMPLSFTQEQLWFLDRLEPGTPVYNVPFALRLSGQLQPVALHRAVDAIVVRHEALRTIFADGPQGVQQTVLPELRLEMPVEDLRPVASADRPSAIQRAMAAHAECSFDLSVGPLLAVRLLVVDDEEHLLLVTAHHIVFDAWSADVFTSELVACYEQLAQGRQAQLPPLPMQFGEHVLRARGQSAVDTAEAHLAHWRRRLAGAPPVSTLPPDRPRPPVQTHRGGRLPLELDTDLTSQVGELARSAGVTVNAVVLAAVVTALQRATGQDDIVLGMPAAGRSRTDTEPLIGCFANMLVLRIDLSGDPTVRELVARTHDTVRDAYAHQDAPYARVVEEVRPPRDPSLNPLFQVMVTVSGGEGDDRSAAGVRFAPESVDNGLTDFDLFITLTHRDDAIEGVLDYNADLYLEESVDRTAGRLPQILRDMARHPDERVRSVSSLRRDAVALAATFTADLVRAPLQRWLDFLRLPAGVAAVPYGQMIAHLLTGEGHAASVCLLRWEDWLRHRPKGEGAADADRLLSEAMRDLEDAVLAYRRRSSAPLVFVVCPASSGFQEPSWSGLLGRLDDRLALLRSRVAGVHVLWAEEQEHYRVAEQLDPGADELGHVPYTSEFSAALATMAARELHRVSGRTARVLLVDDSATWLDELTRGLAHLQVGSCPGGELHERLEELLSAGDVAGDECVVLDLDPARVAALRRRRPRTVALAVPERWEAARSFLAHVWALDRPGGDRTLPLATIGSERAAYMAEHLATPAAVIEGLADAAPRFLATQPVVAPRTATEERLAALWRDALRLDEVGVTADFFALGGHSLLATQLLSRVQAELGAEISLYTLFTHPTIEQLAGVLDGAGASPAEQLTPAPAGAEPVVSSTQERLWALAQLDDDVVRHNTSFAVTLRGALDEAALERALAEVVRCHEALRTTFADRGGRPVPVVHDALGCWVAPADVSWLPDRKRARAIRRQLDAHAGHAYDLAAGPLLRVQVLRTAVDEHVLMIGMHHIICDNTSWNVLLEDLASAYDAFAAGVPSPLAPPPLGFTDFAHHQREWLASDAVERHVAFWRERLRDSPVLELPTDHPRPAVRSDVAGHHGRPLPSGLGAAVREIARAEGVSPFSVLTTAFALLLREQSGQSDLVLGVPTAGRERPELERVIGCFTDLLPLRVDLDGRPSFRRLLRRAHKSALEAYGHQMLPFANIVKALRLPRDPSRHPLFSCVLNVVDLPDELPRFTGLESSPVDLGGPAVDFDLFLTLSWQGDELHADLAYSAELFTPERALALLEGFDKVLSAALAQPDAPIDATAVPRCVAAPANAARPSEAEVVLASSYSSDRVLQTLRFWSDLAPRALSLSTVAPGQVLRPLLDPDGPMGAAADGLNVVLLHWEHWLGDRELARRGALGSASVRVERALADLCRGVRSFRARSDARLLMAVAPPYPELADSLWDGVARRATERLQHFCEQYPAVEVVALEQWSAVYGMTDRADAGRAPGLDAIAGTLIARRAYARARPAVATVRADPQRLSAPAALAQLARDRRRDGHELVLTSPPASAELQALLGAGAVRLEAAGLVEGLPDAQPEPSVVLCADEAGARAVRAAQPSAIAVVAGAGDDAVRSAVARLWLLDPPAAGPPAPAEARIAVDLLVQTATALSDGAALWSAVQSGFRRSTRARPAAPRTDAERALAAIWADLLRLEEVGIHDDFFELGGDSLLAMRIVIAAAEAGIAFTPRQLVHHPTIAELCEAAQQACAAARGRPSRGDGDRVAADRGADQAFAMGDMPVTPAQQWFFDALAPSMQRPAHFNHPYYLQLRRPVAVDVLEQAVERLAGHHDALRLRFSCDGGTWRQRYAAPAGAVPFARHSLTGVAAHEREGTVERLAADAQVSLDLVDGPTARVLHFRLGGGEPDRLLIVAHHLVVDAVSRGILLDDLQRLCSELERGASPRLPAKSASYREWAMRLGDAAAAEQTRGELAFWLHQVQRDAGVMAPDDPAAGTSLASLATIEASLDAGETGDLHEVARVLKAGIRDLLVWSVARAVVDEAGAAECTIATTGHGREDLFDDLDVSRTVGWFQVLFPIRLQLSERGSDARSLREVADQLARVPRNGIGYGLLRCAGDPPARARLAAISAPRIAVNYMGTFGFEEVAGDELLAVCQAPYGPTEDGTCAWPFGLDVTGSVAAGSLRIELSYASGRYRRERMTALLRAIRGHLLGLTRQHAGRWRDERDAA